MTTRYQNEHYEDVARTLKAHRGCVMGCAKAKDDSWCPPNLAQGFADLFAADNPPFCRTCDTSHSIFHASEGLHDYDTGGFDRERFLAA
ncbi:hypothetical protein LCGC14_2468650, partial [marine sediment metagenome]